MSDTPQTGDRVADWLKTVAAASITLVAAAGIWSGGNATLILAKAAEYALIGFGASVSALFMLSIRELLDEFEGEYVWLDIAVFVVKGLAGLVGYFGVAFLGVAIWAFVGAVRSIT